MTVRYRLLILLSIVVAVFLIAGLVIRNIGEGDIEPLLQSEVSQKRVLLSSLLQQKVDPIRAAVAASAHWNDLVEFVSGNSSSSTVRWQQDILDSEALSKHASTLWIYSAGGELVHTLTAPNLQARMTPPSINQLRRYLQKSGDISYYAHSPIGLIYVSGTAIKRTDNGKTEGYYFLGRIFDATLLSELSGRSDGNIEIVSAAKPTVDLKPISSRQSQIQLSLPLNGVDGQAAANLRFTGISLHINLIRKLNDQQILLFALFAFPFLGIVSIAVYRWIGLPLRAVSRSLETKDPALLKPIMGDTSEFGALAKLVQSSFDHHQALMSEIEERRTIESALRDSDSHNRALIAALPDWMFVIDSAGLFLESGGIASGSFPYTAHETIGRSLTDVFPSEVVTKYASGLNELKQTGDPQHLDYSLMVQSTSRHFEARMVTCGDGRCLCLVRDITDRRNLEDQLLQAQKMEGIGRLAGGVAHDFNNLLTAIRGYAELAERNRVLDTVVVRYLRNIQKAADRATGLTTQLLAFARRQVIEPRVVDVNEQLFEIDPMIRRLVHENIELVTLADARLGTVRIDPGQFEQIVVNLAVNARDAMPDGGKLTMITSNQYVSPEEVTGYPDALAGEYVRLEVRDTGMGMTPEIVKRIFEPFFTTKPAGKGTGLGLATCYGIVKQNGGFIAVLSKPGAGSCFDVYLPTVHETSEPALALLQMGSEQTGSEHILVVEDDPFVRDMAVRTLRAAGYQTTEAANGDEAYILARDLAPEMDLVFTDVVMPQMGGRELAMKLRKIDPDIPVLFTSGYTEDTAIGSSLDIRTGFLPKPFTPDILTKSIREILDRIGG